MAWETVVCIMVLETVVWDIMPKPTKTATSRASGKFVMCENKISPANPPTYWVPITFAREYELLRIEFSQISYAIFQI